MLFRLNEILYHILAIPPYFLRLTFDNIHLSLHFNNFVGIGLCPIIQLSIDPFVILNLFSKLDVELLKVNLLVGYGFFKLPLKLILLLNQEPVLPEHLVVLFSVGLHLEMLGSEGLIVLG